VILKLLACLWRRPSPAELRRRQLRQVWQATQPDPLPRLALRLLVRSRCSAAIAAAQNAARTASRLAVRRQRRLTARRTGSASVPLALQARARLCRRHCRRLLWPVRRHLLIPLRRWLAVAGLCLCLRLVLALLWCCGIRAYSKSPRSL
jgi:hypothetical protein